MVNKLHFRTTSTFKILLFFAGNFIQKEKKNPITFALTFEHFLQLYTELLSKGDRYRWGTYMRMYPASVQTNSRMSYKYYSAFMYIQLQINTYYCIKGKVDQETYKTRSK